MNLRHPITLLLCCAVFALFGCSEDLSDDSTTALRLLARDHVPSGTSGTFQGSEAALSGASGATASASASSAATSSTSVSVNQLVREMMLAEARTQAADFLPTAITCADGACNLGSTETLVGTANCAGGGTVTANSVLSTITSNGSSATFALSGGSMTFSSCTVTSFDWNNFPDYTTITLTGDVTQIGSSSAQIVSSSGTTAVISSQGSFALTSSNIATNGGDEQTIDLIYTASGTFTSNSADQTVQVSATYKITGTVDGETVVVDATINETFQF